MNAPDLPPPPEPPLPHGPEPPLPGADDAVASPPETPPRARPVIQPPRYGRYVWILVFVILALITVNTIVTRPNGLAGLSPGQRLPPFAVPLATGERHGAADVATGPHQGDVPACELRESGVLNICQLYEQGPVVLALFVAGGSCPQVLSEMQRLLDEFPQVRFAAVAIRNERPEVRRLVRRLRLSFPVGYDEEGDLAALYKLATCPQVTFARRGGIVQSRALLSKPSLSELRERVRELLAAEAPAT